MELNRSTYIQLDYSIRNKFMQFLNSWSNNNNIGIFRILFQLTFHCFARFGNNDSSIDGMNYGMMKSKSNIHSSCRTESFTNLVNISSPNMCLHHGIFIQVFNAKNNAANDPYKIPIRFYHLWFAHKILNSMMNSW